MGPGRHLILRLLVSAVAIRLPHTRDVERLAVADYRDVLWYTAGALGAGV